MLNKLFKTDRHKDFWKWFTEHQDDFYQFETNKDVLSDLLEKKLKEINEDLAFEITTVKNDGKRELSISTDGERKASKDVIDLVNKAPVLNNWNFRAFRQRISGGDIQIKWGDIQISCSDTYFQYKKDGGKIGIEISLRNFVESNAFKNATLILLDNLIGEYERLTYISWIEFVKLNEEKIEELYPLVELPEILDRVSLLNKQ